MSAIYTLRIGKNKDATTFFTTPTNPNEPDYVAAQMLTSVLMKTGQFPTYFPVRIHVREKHLFGLLMLLRNF